MLFVSLEGLFQVGIRQTSIFTNEFNEISLVVKEMPVLLVEVAVVVHSGGEVELEAALRLLEESRWLCFTVGGCPFDKRESSALLDIYEAVTFFT